MNERQTVVLLAEDNEDDVHLVERAFRLAQLPHAVVVARDGGEALAYLFGEPPYDDRARFPLPAVVILDLNMPRVNGFDVLASVKQAKDLCRIPIVVLSSSDEDADIQRSYDLGANSYLKKPVGFDAFTYLIAEIEEYWLRTNLSPAVPA